MPRRHGSLVLLLACSLSRIACAPPADPEYVAAIERWQERRDRGLRSEDGWLTLVALHWLEPGENAFGSGAENALVLPEGRGPAVAGSFVLEQGQVTVRPEPGAPVMLDGEPVGERVLRTDADGEPDVLEVDGLRLHVIRREDRFGIRVKDPTTEALAAFRGVEYFPIDATYRFDATWVPFDEPKEIPIATVTGAVRTMFAPGYVEFTLRGESLTLEPLLSSLDGDEDYFFIFKDATSGKETYGAGRYLYTDPARDGKVVLDFNKAYNPPCVFTPYATCPLPPPQNRLSAKIEAGEKDYGH